MQSDPAIDEQIHAFLSDAEIEWQEHLQRNAYYRGSRWVSIGPIPPYTSSIDAAMKLVPVECYPWVQFGKNKGMAADKRWHAYIGPPDGISHRDWNCEVDAASPEIALTIAAIIARINISGQEA